MKTNELISELTRNLEPVKKASDPKVSFLKWLSISFLCLGVGLLFFGVREDLHNVIYRFEFSAQLFITLALALLSSFSAFLLSIPDKKHTLVEALPIATGLLWLAFIAFALASSQDIKGGLGFNCVKEIITLGVLPAVALFSLLIRAAPLKKSKVGLFVLLSAAGLGAFGTQLICVNDDPLHVLLWHFVPVIGIGLIGIFAGRMLFRWDSSN